MPKRSRNEKPALPISSRTRNNNRSPVTPRMMRAVQQAASCSARTTRSSANPSRKRVKYDEQSLNGEYKNEDIDIDFSIVSSSNIDSSDESEPAQEEEDVFQSKGINSSYNHDLDLNKVSKPHRDLHYFQSTLSYPIRRSNDSSKVNSTRLVPGLLNFNDDVNIADHTLSVQHNLATNGIDSADSAIPTNNSPAVNFLDLPTEIIQSIIDHLPTERRVINFSSACKTTLVVTSSWVWRKRFTRKFDKSPGLITSEEFHQLYRNRRITMVQMPSFDLRTLSHVEIPVDCQRELSAFLVKSISLFKDLLLESNNQLDDHDGTSTIQGKNLQVIMGLISRIDPEAGKIPSIVDAIFCTEWDQGNLMKRASKKKNNDVHIVQLCLAPYYLGPTHECAQHQFELSQFHVYSHEHPTFIGLNKENVNARLLLHVINFFKFHLKSQEGIFHQYYQDLEPDQCPRPWVGRIKDGVQSIAPYWKGIYTNLDENSLARLRAGNRRGNLFAMDHIQECDMFQDITFFFDRDEKRPWPKQWEDILRSDMLKDAPKDDKARKSNPDFQPKFKDFWGTSRKGDKKGRNGHFFGRIHSMDTQNGIYGFQRIVMMKFDALCVNNTDSYDNQAIYAYEGCVLPGGSMIAGRWWNYAKSWEERDSFGGPFLWWNVQDPLASDPVHREEALRFEQAFYREMYALM